MTKGEWTEPGEVKQVEKGQPITLASSLKSLSESDKPDPWALLGLRAEDLTDAERFRLQRMLDSDPKAAEERFQAITLSSTLSKLPDAPSTGLTAQDVLAQARRQKRRSSPYKLVLAAVLGAGVTALVLRPPDIPWPAQPEMAAGITEVVEHSVKLEAISLGPDGARGLDQDGLVHPGDNVIFQMKAEGPGAVLLTEIDGAGIDRIVFPAVPVNSGDHPGGVYLAYRPDYGLGMRSYVAWLCPEHLTLPDPRRCRADELTITWLR
ncbi:MAG: hypothetical protein HN348_33595 [Proteobacteria bacterium]|nr:hypothetical protein [Pseudomonadota bacterium]